MNKTYSYLRVSTIDQDNDKFQVEVLKYANLHCLGNVEFIEEKISGKKDWNKRKLRELLDSCKSGDNVIVPELSRLSRSISQIYEIIAYSQRKGIILHILKQNLILKDSNDINTKVMLSTFALIAELEREFISIRTKEALHAKKVNGVKLGRPKTGIGKSKLDSYHDEILAFYNNGSTYTWIANKYQTTPITVANWIRKHKTA